MSQKQQFADELVNDLLSGPVSLPQEYPEGTAESDSFSFATLSSIPKPFYGGRMPMNIPQPEQLESQLFFPPNLETTPGPLVPPKPFEKKQILAPLESSFPPSFEDATTNSQSNFPSLESQKFDDKEIKRKIKK